MNDVDRDILYELYIVQGRSMHFIASELKISVGSVFNYIKKYNIPTRSQKENFTMKGRKLTAKQCERISRVHKGEKVPVETRKRISESHKQGGIGHKKKRNDGYMKIYFPDHPCSTKDGYVMEHILVMEALIGRHLTQEECVHHRNGNRSDNRKENLELMTKQEHMSYHAKERWKKKKGE